VDVPRMVVAFGDGLKVVGTLGKTFQFGEEYGRHFPKS